MDSKSNGFSESEISPPRKRFKLSRTKVEISYSWCMKYIEKFLMDLKPRRSPIFRDPNALSHWQIEIDVLSVNNLDFARIELIYRGGQRISKGQKVTFSIMNPIHGKMFSQSKLTNDDHEAYRLFPEFIQVNELRSCIFEARLTILCEVSDLAQLNLEPEMKNKPLYASFLNSEMLSDVVLVIGKEIFAAHKLILSANSPVFHRIFSHEMKNPVFDKLDINDIESETFQELLRYMYTGSVNNLKSLAQGVLDAANKYQMEDLKLICEKFISKSLTVQNALDILQLSDKCKANLLKESSFNFIVSNLGGIVKLDDYKNFSKSNGDLMGELVIRISSSDNSD